MAAAILVPRMFSEQPRIAFTRGDVSGIYGEIYVMCADGSNPTRLTHWVCPASTDCLPLSHSTSSHSSFLVLSGAEMPQCGMPPAGVVEALDVLEDRSSGALALRP